MYSQNGQKSLSTNKLKQCCRSKVGTDKYLNTSSTLPGTKSCAVHNGWLTRTSQMNQWLLLSHQSGGQSVSPQNVCWPESTSWQDGIAHQRRWNPPHADTQCHHYLQVRIHTHNPHALMQAHTMSHLYYQTQMHEGRWTNTFLQSAHNQHGIKVSVHRCMSLCVCPQPWEPHGFDHCSWRQQPSSWGAVLGWWRFQRYCV